MSKPKSTNTKKSGTTKTLDESLPNTKYQQILNVIEKYEDISKLHCLFDTLHDFGKFSISYDTLCNIKTDDKKHNISKMIFSLLAKHCFGISDDNFSRDFSNLTTSVGGLTSNLTAKDLENFFLKYALAKAGNNGKNTRARAAMDAVINFRFIKF